MEKNKKFSKCIICGRDIENLGVNNYLNKEHIIPDCLGNKEFVYNFTCRECNSKIGEKFEYNFCECPLIIEIRMRFKIKGRKKASKLKIVGKYGERICEIHSNNKVYLKSYCKKEGNSLIIKASSEKEIKEILTKNLSRQGFSQEQINKIIEKNRINKTIISKLEIETDSKMSTFDFILEFIKIAYEFMCSEFYDDYFEDEIAIEIRNILYNASRGIDFAIPKYLQLNPVYTKEEAIKESRNLPLHLAILANEDGKIYCNIQLFMNPFLSHKILLSNYGDKYLKDDEAILFYTDAK